MVLPELLRNLSFDLWQKTGSGNQRVNREGQVDCAQFARRASVCEMIHPCPPSFFSTREGQGQTIDFFTNEPYSDSVLFEPALELVPDSEDPPELVHTERSTFRQERLHLPYSAGIMYGPGSRRSWREDDTGSCACKAY